jgi:hypothetical protein
MPQTFGLSKPPSVREQTLTDSVTRPTRITFLPIAFVSPRQYSRVGCKKPQCGLHLAEHWLDHAPFQHLQERKWQIDA